VCVLYVLIILGIVSSYKEKCKLIKIALCINKMYEEIFRNISGFLCSLKYLLIGLGKY